MFPCRHLMFGACTDDEVFLPHNGPPAVRAQRSASVLTATFKGYWEPENCIAVVKSAEITVGGGFAEADIRHAQRPS